MYDINILAVIVSAISAIVISTIWFSPALFGNMWAKLSGFSESDMAEAKAKGMAGMWKQYLIQIIASIVQMAVLAFFIAISGSMTAFDGAFIGAITWLGFAFTINLTESIWLGKPFKLMLINTSNTLVFLIIGGLIMGAWL
jgi:hypothetical protein